MIAFTALLGQGTLTEVALAAHPEHHVARALLSGRRPKRLASAGTLLQWAAEATGTPDFLVTASLAASGDTCEVAALLLPPAMGVAPTLGECLTALTDLAAASEAERRTTFLTFALRLPAGPRLIFARLSAGTFRQTLKPAAPATGGPREFLAVLTMLSPQGPEASFALRHGNGLVPIAKLPLTLPEAREILAWARAHSTERFGPYLAVTPDLVFRLSCEGTVPNARRKSGLDLVAPVLVGWVRNASPDQATTLDQFLAGDQGRPRVTPPRS